MRRTQALLLVSFAVLASLVAIYAARIADHHQRGGHLRAEVGRIKITELAPATVRRLASLGDELLVKFYVTERAAMPSHMRAVERQVCDMLSAMEAAAPEQFSWRVVDPSLDEDLPGYASRRKIAPFRVRSVTRDGYSERTVWSSLTLAWGTRPEVAINGVGPEHVERLQAILVEHLDRMERPRRPSIALAAPRGFDELEKALGEYGRVNAVNLDGAGPFPEDVDLLFWMDPRNVADARLVEIDRFLASGRSLVIAGSRFRSPAGSAPGEVAVERAPYGAETLLAHLGLRPMSSVDGDTIVIDHRAEAISEGTGEAQVSTLLPHRIRCIAPNQDFRTWDNQANGNLLFTLPTPIELDDARLRDRGWTASLIATTSDHTRAIPAPLGQPIPAAGLYLEDPGSGKVELAEVGEAVAKQALIVDLVPDDSWSGRVLALASSTPFADGTYARERTAHWRLLRTVVGEYTTGERLVFANARLERPTPLRAMTGGERVWWRFLAVLLIPALLLAAGVIRGVLRFQLHSSGAGSGTAGAGNQRPVGVPITLALAGAMLFAWMVPPGPPLIDATAGNLNRLAPETCHLAKEVGYGGPITVEVLFSTLDRLPPDLRPVARRVDQVLDDLNSVGANLEVEYVDPASLDEEAMETLVAAGGGAVRFTSQREEATEVQNAFCALRLTHGNGRIEVLRFPAARSIEDVEFRLAFALWRLDSGEQPLVAFASDVKRPSAAEAYENYQQKSLFAPKGTDRYQIARRVLEGLDYRVTHVNPRDPVMPTDADALVWLQPRRSIEPMLASAVRYLHGGGDVLMAVQHFNIQSRQYRGADFDVVHWPQPQSPDVELLYFPDIGIHLVREVLFDELSMPVTVDAQVAGRGRTRDYEAHASALPFQIRASAAGFAADSPVTRNLGDQAFIWANHLDLDRARLAELGLDAAVLMATSERTWTYPWKGGWLPLEMLAGPPLAEAGQATLGRLALAVLVEGQFPQPDGPMTLERLNARASEESEGAAAPPLPTADPEGAPWPTAAAGRLVFIGTSEPFKNTRILDPDHRGDHLLASAVAHLALPADLATIASHRRVVRGLDYVPPAERLSWRAWVVGSGPGLLLLVGLVFQIARHRSGGVKKP